jgi:hypothetical protein
MNIICNDKFYTPKGPAYSLVLSENNLPPLDKEGSLKIGDEVTIDGQLYEIKGIERFHVFMRGMSNDNIGILVKEK